MDGLYALVGMFTLAMAGLSLIFVLVWAIQRDSRALPGIKFFLLYLLLLVLETIPFEAEEYILKGLLLVLCVPAFGGLLFWQRRTLRRRPAGRHREPPAGPQAPPAPDPLLQDVMLFAMQYPGQLNPASLQRRFGVDANRAQTLLTQLETALAESAAASNPTPAPAAMDAQLEGYDGPPAGGPIHSPFTERADLQDQAARLLLQKGFDRVEPMEAAQSGHCLLAIREGVRYGILCWDSRRPVEAGAVQEALSQKQRMCCHVGVVLSHQSFTEEARQWAASTGVLLWDGPKLRQWEEAEKKGCTLP